jgi:hypothetical protein
VEFDAGLTSLELSSQRSTGNETYWDVSFAELRPIPAWFRQFGTSTPTPDGLLMLNFQLISVCLLLEVLPPHVCPSSLHRPEVSAQTGLQKLQEGLHCAWSETTAPSCGQLRNANVSSIVSELIKPVHYVLNGKDVNVRNIPYGHIQLAKTEYT